MRFEVSERIRTGKSKEELLESLDEQFRKISESTNRSGQSLEIKSIEATFGSINRNDTTVLTLKELDDGWLVIANVHYRPSVAFWIILVITLFTWVFWLVPIVFYLLQKGTVQTAIKECFQRVKNEFDSGDRAIAPKASVLTFDDLERLAALKEKGLITDGEFELKKKQILGF